MKKSYAFLFLFAAYLSFAQTILNSGILTNFNINYTGTGSGGGCDNNCLTFSDIGSPYNKYIINTTGTATVNAASGAGILCNNTYASGNHSATTANATYTLTSNCTYTIVAQFGFDGTSGFITSGGNCLDSRADAGDILSITQSNGTTLSQGADIIPGSCGPTHNTIASATGCGNAILTATLVVQTGASAAIATISYTSNRADEVCAFQISANSAVCGAMVLPVNLLAFTANKTGENNVLVKWVTAEEVNNDYFVLEYSLDGKNFANYAQIKGKGTTNSTTEYSNNFNEDIGNNIPYFRLKQVDFNGKYQYSTVISVGNYIGSAYFKEPSQAKFYYDAGNDKIMAKFKTEQAQEVTITIYSSAGKEISSVKKYFYEGNHEMQMLPPEVGGVYILVYETENTVPIHKKVMIEK